MPEIRTFLCRSDNIGVLIRDPATGACAAIDVPEAGAVLRVLGETGWSLTDILVTHRHFDHVEGTPEVKARTGARVTAPAKAGDAVPEVDATVREGDAVRLGSLVAAVWETPGHCADHVTYWFERERIAFAGDTLFTLGCGRVMESPPEVLWRSLSRFLALPDETAIYSGHDYVLSNARFALAADPDNPNLKARAELAERVKRDGRFLIPTTLGEEKATNPFLRATEPALARAVGMAPGSDPAAVFTALREWKNRF
ncbi:hydroxyacylglutathione hydrolase [Methylobacterium sp. 4-46]|uniref:Hydroxyacylglutathione hydrolase n=1 Tax=Methylobacterium sp. (strain 4-46) TaxID=426117 RepID=GLO2_METS4|nr:MULTISPECIES: hydroxyacylglutathione hydrolase [Methylobacterium]B0UBD0.1 RecName: Full=Hydroxyacylglutathione hydrolase; AltName: Full=Glyoxalase II; Short=Glx II [Methylobacterium sp. 4-46]ACA16526.1 hydroxyacylglutathione hydrolase [Methylobacterium sp. 4-46]WFT82235.1 hydroxyacylglutathione hydrolase [Methylobacterium nodulans]